MAEAPIMPLATDAYLADTTHLTTTEHGAYLLLLMCLWRAGGRLPNDPRQLAKFCRLSATQFKRIWPTLEPFFFIEGDHIGQGKCDDFLDAVRRKSEKASDSARAKWRKNKKTAHANASPEQCERNAIQDPTNQDPVTPPVSPPAGGEKKRGSRLPGDWRLPRSWGEWAVSELGMSEEGVRLAAANFADYWHATPGAKGRKLDWQATWRIWCRRDWRKKPAAVDRRKLTVDEDLDQRGFRDLENDKRGSGGGGHNRSAPPRDAADDVPPMLTAPAQEEGPLPGGDLRDGPGTGVLPPLRLVMGGVSQWA